MKLYPIALLISSILLLSACQGETIKQTVEDEQQIERETTPIEKIKEDTLYSWKIQDGERAVELYLIADGGTMKDGDKQYNGNLAFYLVDGEHGVLQEHLTADLESVSINLDKSPFKISPFGDQTMITWINPEASDSKIGRASCRERV